MLLLGASADIKDSIWPGTKSSEIVRSAAGCPSSRPVPGCTAARMPLSPWVRRVLLSLLRSLVQSVCSPVLVTICNQHKKALIRKAGQLNSDAHALMNLLRTCRRQSVKGQIASWGGQCSPPKQLLGLLLQQHAHLHGHAPDTGPSTAHSPQ